MADRPGTAHQLLDFRSGQHRCVVVGSPPGAGKSTLVVRAAAELVEDGEHLMIVAQANDKVDDLTASLAGRLPSTLIGRLSASDYVPSARIAGLPNVACDDKAGNLAGYAITVATAAK